MAAATFLPVIEPVVFLPQCQGFFRKQTYCCLMLPNTPGGATTSKNKIKTNLIGQKLCCAIIDLKKAILNNGHASRSALG
jgi:hypothetical protein